jgi:hypothetical protein
MLYHVEFRGENGWEAFGSGEGSGEDPVGLAMADLTAVAGGTLPAGEYRCIAARSDSIHWETVWLDASGKILDTEAESSPSTPR